MLFPLIEQYKSTFQINSDLDALLHLTAAAPVLNDLMAKDKREEHFALELPMMQKATADFPLLEKALMFGYYQRNIEKSQDQHSWVHLQKQGRRNPKIFNDDAYQIDLPYGLLTAHELSTNYPEIAAINLLLSSYGNPILNMFRDYLEKHSNKTLEAADRQIFEIINDNTPETGGELREYAPIGKDELRSNFFAGLFFLDEPKIYQDSAKYFERFMASLEQLNQTYFVNPNNHFQEIRKTYNSIENLRSASNYFEALMIYDRDLIGFPYFPVFAFNRFDEISINALVFSEGSKRVEDLNKQIKDSLSPDAKKASILEDLGAKIKEYKARGYERDISPVKLLLELKEGVEEDSLFYTYHGIFQDLLEYRTSLYVQDHFLGGDKTYIKVELQDKELRDLAALALILKAVGIFKSEIKASEFISKLFEVQGKNGYTHSYKPSTIINNLNRLKNTDNQQFLKDQLDKIKEAISSEA